MNCFYPFSSFQAIDFTAYIHAQLHKDPVSVKTSFCDYYDKPPLSTTILTSQSKVKVSSPDLKVILPVKAAPIVRRSQPSMILQAEP